MVGLTNMTGEDRCIDTKHIVWHNSWINIEERNLLNNHRSGLVWFTGLSASGKSTLAHAVELELYKRNIRTYVLDGDNVRHGLNKDLGFTAEDRKENIRRVAEVSRLFVDAGLVVLAAFISPFRIDRQAVRNLFTGDIFFEIYLRCPLEECVRRDPKGNYRKAKEGIISNYTAISSPYEEPDQAHLIIDTNLVDVQTSTSMIVSLIETSLCLENATKQ